MVQELEEIKSVQNSLNGGVLFGKLCVELRNQKEIVLLSLLNTAKRYEVENGYFVLYMDNDVEYRALTRQAYITLIEKVIAMPVRIELLKKEDTQTLEEYLKEKINGLIID